MRGSLALSHRDPWRRIRDRQPSLAPEHEAELEGMSEQLVPWVRADPVIQPTADVGRKLQHETLLSGAVDSAVRGEPVSARLLLHRFVLGDAKQQFDDDVFRREAVERHGDLKPHALSELESRLRHIDTAQSDARPCRTNASLPRRDGLRRGVGVIVVAAALIPRGTVDLGPLLAYP